GDEVALLLLLGAVAEQGEGVQPDVDGDQRPERGLAPFDLLAGERLGDEVEPGAAVLLRDDDPEDAELGHSLDELQVELVVDVVLDGDRKDALVDECADGVLDQPLLVGELEVHAAESMDPPRREARPGTFVAQEALGSLDRSIDQERTMPTAERAVDQGPSFSLTDEQRALRDLARDFAEKEIRPKAAEYDVHMTHPADVIARAHAVGLMNLHVPAAYGGPELGLFEGALVAEELNWGCSGIGTSLGCNGLGAGPVVIAGTEEQKREWLVPLLEEPILCSFGLSEPDAGSDVARIKTTAVRRGDEYVLNGSKTFITNAGYAAWTVVFVKTDPERGHRGISAFVVPMDTPGVTIEQHLDKMGQRATDTSAFALQDVVVPAANRIGEEGRGFKIAMRTLDFTRPGTAAGAVGVAQAAYELSVGYAKERVTFDVPIAMHQGINFLIADMATEIEAARLLTWQAAWLIDRGERATLHSSFAKRFSADTAMKVTTDAVQVFGGYGYMKEYPVEKLMRDAKLFQIYEGTSQIQRLVIAKEIFLPRG